MVALTGYSVSEYFVLSYSMFFCSLFLTGAWLLYEWVRQDDPMFMRKRGLNILLFGVGLLVMSWVLLQFPVRIGTILFVDGFMAGVATRYVLMAVMHVVEVTELAPT